MSKLVLNDRERSASVLVDQEYARQASNPLPENIDKAPVLKSGEFPLTTRNKDTP